MYNVGNYHCVYSEKCNKSTEIKREVFGFDTNNDVQFYNNAALILKQAMQPGTE